MYDYPPCQTLDVKVDLENPEAGMKEIFQALKPKWDLQDQLMIKMLSNGMLNRGYMCSAASDVTLSDAVVVKVFKYNSDALCPKDEERELFNWSRLNAHCVGVPLFARFKNGNVQKVISGSLLDHEGMNDPHIARLAAEQLAAFHNASVSSPEHGSAEGPMKLYVDGTIAPGDLNWYDSLARVSLQHLRRFTEEGKHTEILRKFLSVDDLDKHYADMKSYLESREMELVVCHNDCWRENILYDKPTDSLMIIDYEILDRNFASFDLGVFLVACAENPPEIDKRPSEEFCKDFVRTYLRKRRELRTHGKNPPSDVTDDVREEEVDTWYRNACLCMPMRAFYIAVIMLYFYILYPTPKGWDILFGFYRFYLDSKALYWQHQ